MITNRCMNCGGNELRQFIDLGDQPNGNSFPTIDTVDDERCYPCTMLVCIDCWQVQLKEFPPVEEMFSDHPYVTGLNQPVVRHFERLSREIVDKVGLEKNDLVLDIGANDGTLMRKFRELGMRVLGVDPCRQVGELSRADGLTVCRTFWNRETAGLIRRLGLVPDLITATAVFYHVADMHDFIDGLDLLMDDDSVFCVQCVYLKDVIENAHFDQFYHEHTMIHAIAPLERIFTEHGMRLLDVEFYDVHGGSFVLYVVRDGSDRSGSGTVATAIAAERAAGLDKLETYLRFAARVDDKRKRLHALLGDLNRQGKRVFGLGAPVKGNTLLNFYDIGVDRIECLTEVNVAKIGRLSPGKHIPVVDERSLPTQPDYYLLLSWNYLEFFVEKYAAYLESGGYFIVPHPDVMVIGAPEEGASSHSAG